MIKLLANLITFVLHPIILSLLAVFLIVYRETGDMNTAYYWTFISVFFAVVISLFVLVGIKKGFFTNIDVSVRKQRVILYPFAAAVMLLFVLVLLFFNGPKFLLVGLIAFIASLGILDVINRKIKASIHVATVAALSVGIIEMFGLKASPVLFAVPFVAWARVLEKKHTVKETIAGFLSGSILAIIGIIVVQYLLRVLL